MRPTVLIIGSGAGGSVIAKSLANKFDVTLMEEGGRTSTIKWIESITASFVELYRYGGVLPIFSRPIIGFAEGRVVGGSTVVNGGLLWRTPTKILNQWLNNKQISKNIFDKYQAVFDVIEKRLNVNYQTISDSNKDSSMLAMGAQVLGWKIVDVPRAVIGCSNQNRCPSSCNSGAKQSMDKTYLADAEKNGVVVLSGVRVDRLLMRGNHVDGVCYFENGKLRKKKFDYVFVCAGAIQTPIILRKSGIKSGIGNSLSLHLNMKFLAQFEEAIDSKNGTIFSKQIQEFEDEGTLIMATNFNESWAMSSLESKGPVALENLKDNIDRFAMYTTQIKPLGVGKVRSLLGLGTFCSFKFAISDKALIARAIESTARVLFAAGAKKIYLPIHNVGSIQSIAEAQNLLLNLKPKDLELLSVHAMATVPMGEYGAVDYEGKVVGYENLFVADASILPSSIGESPQGTIMYLAQCIADSFIERAQINDS